MTDKPVHVGLTTSLGSERRLNKHHQDGPLIYSDQMEYSGVWKSPIFRDDYEEYTPAYRPSWDKYKN